MKNKKSILMLRSSIGIFGVERVMLELAKGISESEFEPIIGVIENKNKQYVKLAVTAQLMGFRTNVFECNLPFDPRTVLGIHKYIKKHRIDLVHTHGYKANFYGLMSTIFSKVPCIATCHPWTETEYSLKARIYTFLDKKWLKMMNAIIAVSDEVKQQLVTHSPKMKIDVIPNGIDIERVKGRRKDLEICQKLGLSKSDLIIGTIGRLVPEKGYTFLINSAKAICSKYPKVEILFIGDGPLRCHLEREVAKLRLQSNIKFLGVRNDIPELLSLMDIFVLPSLSEGVPVVLLEAMAAGKLIIATTVGAIPQIITHGDSGLLVPAGDSEALTNAIEFFIKNRKQAKSMAQTARKEVSQNYSVYQMAQRYIEQYEKLAA